MAKIITQFLTPNKLSRPQKPMSQIKGLVLHWVANPNTTAKQNWQYFENKKLKPESNEYGSAHEIIDLNGDSIICLPDNEIAYHVGSNAYTDECIKELGNAPNYCSYGIECTHIDWNGTMTKETYDSLVNRCVELCVKYKLDPLKNIWTHKQVVGWKECHRWFVDNPQKWQQFKQEVCDKIQDAVDKINLDKVLNNKTLNKTRTLWQARFNKGQDVNSDMVQQVIMKFVDMYIKVATYGEAVIALKNMGVISSPDYWLQHTGKKKVKIEYVKKLFVNMGKHL
jgi:N-acetylmuramoyl-L-alanine amidase